MSERRIPRDRMERQLDPTVCVECERDFGHEEIPKLAGVPICEVCGERYRNRPYPAWVKLGLAALVLLTLFSFARNWRFMAGYIKARRAITALKGGRIEDAHRYYSAAAENVPEKAELRAMADFFEGLMLLKDEKYKEAAAAFRRSGGLSSIREAAEFWTLVCEANVAFDEKDYDRMLEKATALYKLKGNDGLACGLMASASACKFAVSGDEKYRKQALEFLDRAEASGDMDREEMRSWKDRILYRLEAKEIIDSQEFKRRFPDGWKGGGAKKAAEEKRT
ncbi:MAG: hypothetical protein N3A38_03740 [Planctomycetota bacterium]|nr:hypothetical protein [Planctomycetota bacterium]